MISNPVTSLIKMIGSGIFQEEKMQHQKEVVVVSADHGGKTIENDKLRKYQAYLPDLPTKAGRDTKSFIRVKCHADTYRPSTKTYGTTVTLASTLH